MKKAFIEAVKNLYGYEAKVMITSSRLRIIYSSCPSLVEKLERNMFSRSSIAPDDNKRLFPIKKISLLSLWVNGVCYAARVMPIMEGKSRYYCIELADTTDYLNLAAVMQTSVADEFMNCEIRRATAGVYASRVLAEERVYGYDFKKTKDLCDRSCNMLMRTIANPTELLYYTAAQPERRVVNIGKVTDEVCSMYSMKMMFMGGYGCKVTCDPIKTTIKAVCKGERLAIALLNLIENGLLYNISEEKQVHVSVERRNDEVRISVTDNGLGMSLDAIEKAFIPYALCEPGETYGCLGLPLADMFAKTYGGSVNIVSKQDEGTTVTIRLPASDGVIDDAFSPASSYDGERFSMMSTYITRIIDREL